MKKWLALLAAFVYSVPAAFFLPVSRVLARDIPIGNPSGFILLPGILMLAASALAVANIAGAAIAAIRRQCLSFRSVLVFKLCLIPFYILNFLVWLTASLVFHIALVVWPFIPFIIAYTYLTMLGTSAHVIAGLLTLCRSGKITAKQFFLHSVWQLVFAADVIDCIYLAVKQKKLDALPGQ